MSLYFCTRLCKLNVTYSNSTPQVTLLSYSGRSSDGNLPWKLLIRLPQGRQSWWEVGARVCVAGVRVEKASVEVACGACVGVLCDGEGLLQGLVCVV